MRIQIKPVLPEPPARRWKMYIFFWKIKKSDVFLGNFFFFPISVPLRKCSTVGQGRSGVRFPLVHCRSVGLSVEFGHVFPEFGARARSSPEFWHFNPEPSPIFPKKCHYFGTFTPSPIFPKSCHNFGAFHEYKFWELSFCVSVILNLPHATVALLNSL